jgi:hypothetical protein
VDTAENPSARHRHTNADRPQHELLEIMGIYFLKGLSLTFSCNILVKLLRLLMAKTQMDTCYIGAGGNVGTQSLSKGPNNINPALGNKQN